MHIIVSIVTLLITLHASLTCAFVHLASCTRKKKGASEPRTIYMHMQTHPQRILCTANDLTRQKSLGAFLSSDSAPFKRTRNRRRASNDPALRTLPQSSLPAL